MKKLFLILTALLITAMPALASEPAQPQQAEQAQAAEPVKKEEKKIDPKEIIFEHLGDGYGWEVPFNHHKRIPLPIIVWGSDGLHVFSSSRVEHGQTWQDGNATFRIAQEGSYKGKVVEMLNGEETRPWDFSITKNVLALLIAAGILIILCLWLASWHKRNGFKAPRKGLGAFEVCVDFVYSGVIKPTLGDQARRFAPYLLTVFFFILLMNLLGLIVIFPGGANLTGNIGVTLTLALCTFFITNVFATKHYWKEIFWPDVPLWLKCPIPIMQIIEIFGIFTKPAALTVRLFANMMGGHMIVLVLTILIFLFADMGAAAVGATTAVSMIFSIFMLLLDCLVSFIQAYVFTMLSTVFIGLAQAREHEHEEKEAKKHASEAATATEAAQPAK
ncbi:MAG: F0F1 ATP synthase subunit A [Bacteroidales bacterium]|nr:F0F1 ATP synthase subunit A [Bacteroidales bacterium]MCD8393727.1 F0F1 ATP synthase subunit A [Bacteroidales bacterium]